MKTLFAAALVIATVAAAGSASAQVAAGSMPNTFDRPAAAPAAVAQAPTPAPAPVMPVAPAAPANAAAEDTLRTIIAGAQAGTLDYTLMTDDLAAQVRAQEATVLPLLQGFGVVQAVDFVGNQSGFDIFAVTFATTETQWLIGLEEGGKVTALRFRPTPTEPAAPAPAPAR